MNDKTRNAQRTEREWLDLIQECRMSGLSDKDWCEQHAIPISTFYTKITRLRKKSCAVPAASHLVIRESQQVVPLPIIDDATQSYRNVIPNDVNLPAVTLKINDYHIEISNHAGAYKNRCYKSLKCAHSNGSLAYFYFDLCFSA